jgi:hypothetical protein
MQNLMNVNFRNISGVDAVLGDASVAISAKLFEAMNEYCFRTY